MREPDLRETVAQHLSTLAELGEAHGMHTIGREIREERLPLLKEGRMSMVVLGEFNHGKSSVINALLGRDVLPTGITPTTSVITHIISGDGPAKVVREERVEELSPEALRERIISDAPDDLRHVEVPARSDFLSDGLYIVDTPGVNDISQQKVEITYGYVPRADVIVYVLDANQALKRSEIAFIRDRLLRDSHRRIFFVLGKADTLSEEELAEIETHVTHRLEPLVGRVRLFPVSARNALQGGDAGFEAFRAAISEFLRRERQSILIESAARTGLRLSSLVDHHLAIEMSALELGDDELAERVAKVRTRLGESRVMVADHVALIEKRIADLRATTRESLHDFTGGFVEAIPREIERASSDDIKRYLPDFIHDTFKDYLEAEGATVAMRLEALAEEIITITNRNMRQAMADAREELGVSARDIDLEVDTFGYDVSVFALGAAGVTFLAFSNFIVGGMLTVAAPVLAFALKGKVDERIRERATEQATASIRLAGERIEAELMRSIQEFADRLRTFVEDAGDRLYRQLAESLDRITAERKRQGEDTSAIEPELREGRTRAAELMRAFRDIRAQALPDRLATEASHAELLHGAGAMADLQRAATPKGPAAHRPSAPASAAASAAETPDPPADSSPAAGDAAAPDRTPDAPESGPESGPEADPDTSRSTETPRVPPN